MVVDDVCCLYWCRFIGFRGGVATPTPKISWQKTPSARFRLLCHLICTMFESLSRTVICTGELSALICVIPRGTELIPPCLDYHISVLYTVVQLLSGCCPVDHKYPMYWTLTINDI